MIRRLFAVGCLVAVAAGAGFAQNARVNALAGAFTIPDMSWVLSNPAYALDYKDAVQATYSGSSSPLIGVKSLGDMLVIGGTYTYRGPAGGSPDAAPHLIIGADLDAIKVGIEAFYERSIATSKTEEVVVGANTTVITENRTVSSIPGVTLGLNMDIDVAALAIVAGVRLPGSIAYALTDNSLTLRSESTTSSRDVALSAGLEAVVDVSEMDVTVGLTGVMLLSGKSTVETSSSPVGGTAIDTTYPTGTTDRILGAGVYLGAAKDLEDVGALVAAQVEAGMVRGSTSPFEIDSTNYDPGKDASNTLYLNLRGAIEKTWDELERLDAFVLRSGLVYGVSTTISHEDGEVTGLTHMERSKAAATRMNPLDGAVNGFDLTLGLGINKGIVSFDVELSPTAMVQTFKLVNGNFDSNPSDNVSEPDFISATLTFDFMSRD